MKEYWFLTRPSSKRALNSERTLKTPCPPVPQRKKANDRQYGTVPNTNRRIGACYYQNNQRGALRRLPVENQFNNGFAPSVAVGIQFDVCIKSVTDLLYPLQWVYSSMSVSIQ